MTLTELKAHAWDVYRKIRHLERELALTNQKIEEAENGTPEISETAGDSGRPKGKIKGNRKASKTGDKTITG